MEEEETVAMLADDTGEEPLDPRAQAELVQYLSKGEARTSEGSIAALDAFKKSKYARTFLRFFSQDDEEELHDNFQKLLDSMHLEQYSSGQNILMQSNLPVLLHNMKNVVCIFIKALLKKKFLFVINGSLLFGAEIKQDPPLTSTFVLPNGIQARKRTFAENEIQFPRVFYPGEAVTPSMYGLFSSAKELIACHEKNEGESNEFKDRSIHVATLSGSQYNEIMEQMEEKKLNCIIQFMKISGIFSSITEEKLAKLASLSEIRETKYGSIIFQETEIADEIFLVISGEFMITTGCSSIPMSKNTIDRQKDTDHQTDTRQPVQRKIMKIKQHFGNEEVSPRNGLRKSRAECVSQQGAVLVLQKHFFNVNSDIRMNPSTQENNNNICEFEKQQQSSDFFMKQHFTRKSATNIQYLNQITDQQSSMITTSAAKIPLDRVGQKAVNSSEYDSPNNNNNNMFTKLQISQMQSNTPVIAAYSKSNKHLSQILGSKFIPKNIPNLQKVTSMEESTTYNSQQPISQSPTIFTHQLGNGTLNGGGGSHFHSRSNIHFNNSYFSNGSNNESQKLFSPCVSQKELGDNSIASPTKIKSSLFRARKYQSERSIQNLSPPVQDGMKQQGNVKTMEVQNYNTNTTEQEDEGTGLIGEIVPERKNPQEQSEKGITFKFRPNPKKSEFFTHQFENNNFDEKDGSNDDNNGNDTTQQPQQQSNLQEQKGFYSPKKIIASPIQKKNSHRLFLNDSSPSIIFSKRAFQKGLPGRVDSRIGSFGSQDFNYPGSDGIENDGTPTPNGAGSKNDNTSDNTPNKGCFGSLSGAPGLKINLVTRKKPVSVMGSFSQFQSLKHIHDCDDDENRQQINTNNNNNENETQKAPSLPKRFKNASTIIFSKPLDSQDIDKSNLIGACSPQHPLKILKTLPLSRPQPSLSSTYFSHLSPKKNFVLQQSITKESSNQDSVIPQSLPSPGMKTSLQSSIHKDLQQTFTALQAQSEEEGQILSSQKLNSSSKFPAHPQRHISKSQKHIFKSQPQLQLEVSQKIEGDESSESEADESFTMYNNLAQTSIPLESPNSNNDNTSIQRDNIPAQSLKFKPSIPLLDLKSLGENGSQINNFFGNSGQQNKNQFATEGNKPAISIEKSNEFPSGGKISSGEQNGNEILPLKNSENPSLSQSTTWYQSKTLTNISKMKPQEGATEATTAKILRSESQKPSKMQQPYIEIQSQRPSTPSMKKLNLSNLTAQIKKFAPPPNVKEKDDGFNEIQQSRLILPSFNFSQSGQTSSQPLFFNSQSNESSPTNQQFRQIGISKGLLQDRKTAVGMDSLSFFTPQPLHALSPSSFNQFPMKSSGSMMKLTQSSKSINLTYAGLLSSQTADRKAQKILYKQGEALKEGSPIQEPV